MYFSGFDSSGEATEEMTHVKKVIGVRGVGGVGRFIAHLLKRGSMAKCITK